MEPVRASSGQNTLPGEILPTDQTLAADGGPPRAVGERLSSYASRVLLQPLRPLASGESNATHDYELAGRSLKLPAYDVSGRVVWGLTHQMLSSFFQLLRGR